MLSRFTGIADPDNIYTSYEFNPCKDFSDGDRTTDDDCQNVSVSQL